MEIKLSQDLHSLREFWETEISMHICFVLFCFALLCFVWNTALLVTQADLKPKVFLLPPLSSGMIGIQHHPSNYGVHASEQQWLLPTQGNSWGQETQSLLNTKHSPCDWVKFLLRGVLGGEIWEGITKVYALEPVHHNIQTTRVWVTLLAKESDLGRVQVRYVGHLHAREAIRASWTTTFF